MGELTYCDQMNHAQSRQPWRSPKRIGLNGAKATFQLLSHVITGIKLQLSCHQDKRRGAIGFAKAGWDHGWGKEIIQIAPSPFLS